jgi:hypothetical protein
MRANLFFRLSSSAFLFFLLFCSAPLAAGQDIALILTDTDIFLAHRGLDGLSLGDGLRARAFCLPDLTPGSEAESYVEGSPVILVDVMDDNLSSFVRDKGYLAGEKKIIALRGSKDDAGLVKEGFVFEPALSAYFDSLSPGNIANMARRAASLYLSPSVSFAGPSRCRISASITRTAPACSWKPRITWPGIAPGQATIPGSLSWG